MRRQRSGGPRLAFANFEGPLWTAGGHYLRNLFAALRSLDAPERPDLMLLGAPAGELAPLVDRTLVPPGTPYTVQLRQRIARKTPAALSRLLEPRLPLEQTLRAAGVDALFSLDSFGPRFELPLAVWIPDFQHLSLPEMFQPGEVEQRNQQLQRVTSQAGRVVLSSQSVLADFARFLPRLTEMVRVVPFVAQVPPELYEQSPAAVCARYGLPERFFFLPNQFWKHKNHRLVVEAVCIARERRPELAVVCTGNTTDVRNPLYFGELLALIAERGLRNHMLMLGLVPHGALFQLMRQALALLQPSLFEGWSTSVEEARSLGKRVLASAIPAHCEQNPPHGHYFDPHDPEALARLLVECFDECAPGPDAMLEAEARAQLPERTRRFGASFLGMMKELITA